MTLQQKTAAAKTMARCQIGRCTFFWPFMAGMILVILYTLNTPNIRRKVETFVSPSLSAPQNWISGHLSRTVTPPPTSTLNPQVVKKLDTIYLHLNTTRNQTIFPAVQVGGKYVMLNTGICKDAPRIDVIIIVHTATKHLVKRQRMRETFAYAPLFLPHQVRIVFLLGRPKSDSEMAALREEHIKHNDTIMGDFIDDYHNLTYKGVMGYHWVSNYCPNSDIVLKIDDDVIVDMYKLLSRYIPFMRGRRSIFCNVWNKNMAVMRTGKWGMSKNMFPNMTRYPYYYCSGFLVLMSTDLTTHLYQAAKVTPFFWVDDVYLFGMLPRVAGGVTYHHYAINANITIKQSLFQQCLQTHGTHCSYFATLVEDKSFRTLWGEIQNTNKRTQWQPAIFFEK